MLVALDIETSCAVKECPGHGGHKKCSHALSPWHAKIDCIGLWAPDFKRVFRSLDAFEHFLCTTSDFKFVAHNGKFDLLHLRVWGVKIPLTSWVGDTQLMAYVTTNKIPAGWLWAYEAKRKKLGGSHRKARGHSLKTLAPYFLGVEPFWEPEGSMDDDEYVLLDCEYTYRLYTHFTDSMSRGEREFYEERLLPWTKRLLQAEERGLLIDQEKMAEIEGGLKKREHELRLELDQIFCGAYQAYHSHLVGDTSEKYTAMKKAAIEKGKDPVKAAAYYGKLFRAALQKLPVKLNLESPTQVMWLLRDHLGLNVIDLEGKESTGVSVLERLASEGHEGVGKLLELRKTTKLLSYIESYKDLQADDGCIHPSFNPTGTRTGRLSSSNPNCQQVNKKLKLIFRARPGYKLVGYDLASIEAKLIAFYSEDPALYEIVESGQSLHDYNVKVFFKYDTPMEDVKATHPVERAATKNCGFALFYGAGKNRIQQTFANKGFMFDEYQCEEMLNNYRDAYQNAFVFHKEVTRVFEAGEVVPNILGRPLKIYDPKDAYMKGFNTLIQSSASDLNLEAMEHTLRELEAKGIDAHLLLLVHDFIGIEVEKDKAEEAEKILVRNMTKFKLPTKYGDITLGAEGYIADRWED